MDEPGSFARPAADMDFLANGGEMGKLIRLKDWSATPLGPIEGWPQSLRTTVSLCLASNFPINIIWGPQHTQLYNDGYRVLCGEGHPEVLGMDYAVAWASAWPAIGGPFATALAGETSFLENQRMFLNRNGYLEETFFTFSLSPIRDETGGIGGLFHPVNETTASMLGERRTRAVHALTVQLGEARTTGEVFAVAADVLADFPFDLPFVLLYRLEQPEDAPPRYRLTAHAGLPTGTLASPETLDLDTATPWPIRDLLHSEAAIVVRSVAGRLGAGSCGPYEEPPGNVFVVPVRLPGSELPAALMIAGASPRLPLDDAYRDFCDLVAAAFAAALTTTQAYEEGRRRAEALAAIDRAKTAFFSNVSHEFRTPLTLLLEPIEAVLADADTLPAAQRERLQLAHRNALRLLRLVNSLLDFSRIEAGRVEMSLRPVDLAGLTAELASNFRSACERAHLDLVVDCPPLDGPVQVDQDMWEKIVLNLVSNAFKFTLEGSIAVSLHRVGAWVELVVHDTGVGIPAAELPKVFERFYRIEGQRGRTHEGTGIGLALVEELVRLHGGTIGVSSPPGGGTEFRVVIPFATADLPRGGAQDGQPSAPTAIRAGAYVEEALRWLPDQDGQQPEAAPDVPDGAPARPRIVLAEDNADMRAYVARILRSFGYAVEAVGDGLAALAAVRRGPPVDLVLADVMMPGLDGFALLAALRAEPAMQGRLVILLSARAGEEARIDGLRAGADDYLVKPFSARELRARVDGAIRLAGQRREAAAREQELRAEIATEQGRAALRESEQRLQFALDAGHLGSWGLDLVTRRFSVSQIGRDILGLAAADVLATRADLQPLLHPDDRERHDATLLRAIAGRTIFDVEYRTVRPDAEAAWVQVRGHAVYAEDGTPLSMVGVLLDITARKQAEARQSLLLAELNHRVKNTLATVQSIAMQTQRSAGSPEQFRQNLSARIGALARAHDLLTKASWEGAALAEIVRQTLAPYAGDADGVPRVAAEGPPVRLNPNAAVTLNMAFHELATNAAKYGALSVPGGRVRVEWRVRVAEPDTLGLETLGPDTLEIVWSETGGPEVAAPDGRGFGSRLIEQGLPGEFGGEVQLAFAPDGVRCRMSLPVSAKIVPLDR